MLKAGHSIVRCARCCLRYEESGGVPAACSHCREGRASDSTREQRAKDIANDRGNEDQRGR